MVELLPQESVASSARRFPEIAGFCTEDLINNLIAAALVGTFAVIIWRPLERFLKRRFGNAGSPTVFTDELRLGLVCSVGSTATMWK